MTQVRRNVKSSDLLEEKQMFLVSMVVIVRKRNVEPALMAS